MTLHIPPILLSQIRAHGEGQYPEEGAGVLLGRTRGADRWVDALLPFDNSYRAESRHHRYRITPNDMLWAEDQAERLNMEVVGVFHSHPDQPALASDYDRQWALPWFSYVITSVVDGMAAETRSWRLTEDRSAMVEEAIASQPVGTIPEVP